MKEKKNKKAQAKQADSTYIESETRKTEAVVKDMARIIEKEFRREIAISEEINTYTDGKQIVLSNFK